MRDANTRNPSYAQFTTTYAMLSTVGPVSFGPIGSQYLTSGVRKILELSSLIIKILS
jgi:hypothetical protein